MAARKTIRDPNEPFADFLVHTHQGLRYFLEDDDPVMADDVRDRLEALALEMKCLQYALQGDPTWHVVPGGWLERRKV